MDSSCAFLNLLHKVLSVCQLTVFMVMATLDDLTNADETLTSSTFYTFPAFASPVLHNFINLYQTPYVIKLF
jgi:hypothetical protein